MIDLLGGAKAKVIANTTFFFEPQRDAGLAYIEKLMVLQQQAAPADAGKRAQVMTCWRRSAAS
jgi:serine/threonine-protein kinase